jgi:hypothetical protein
MTRIWVNIPGYRSSGLVDHAPSQGNYTCSV